MTTKEGLFGYCLVNSKKIPPDIEESALIDGCGRTIASSIVASMPVIILYFFLGKNLIEGLTAGAVK